MRFAELDCLTHYSFLEGASYPVELVKQARMLGLAAIGVADRNSLAGIVRAWQAGKEEGLPVLTGCRLRFTDGAELIVYPRDRAAYGRLCRLLSIGKAEIGRDTEVVAGKRIAKGDCILTFEQAAGLGEGLIALAPAPADIDAAFEARLKAWRAAWPDQLHLLAAPLHRGDDRARLNALAALARRTGAPMVASNGVLYHHYERRRLQDVLTCVRHGLTIDQAGLKLEANAERFLKDPDEMARLFRGHEDAIERTMQIVQACGFTLDDLKYRYPDEPVPPGKTATGHLRDLAIAGARRAYPQGAPPDIVKTLLKELKLIRKVKYEHYFLTVHDIVHWARRQDILCQGRGSAANSVVCYFLGITSVDPTKQDVLFERFISEERSEPPDIDVDFEHERREEVIQYVYRRYGRHRAAICATQICYRPRSAIRDVGKALGLTEDVTAALAGTVWGSWGDGLKDDHVKRTGLDGQSPRLKLALELTQELIGFPRHLSQHVGGFVLTQEPLVETVPVGNAAMPDRTFIEWDKDDIDALGIMKVDVLALGMLTAISKSFSLVERHYPDHWGGERLTLASLPKEDPQVYDMLCAADSVGTFQVESRAQMAMLPRLQPRVFYDLVVEVAIVRPGPIQGGMVHPYLKARKEKREVEKRGGKFDIDFPTPGPQYPPTELKDVLFKTLGVPLFQEQAMRIAMVAAQFSGGEANGLRRAMATFRHMGTIHQYEEMMVGRMIARGYDPQFANSCFAQIRGFGEYGFPESHAAAFAQLVYVSAWLKCFYPEVFCAALLNSQPMGFYSSAQLVRDAKEHGVDVLPPDVGASAWDCTLEPALARSIESRHPVFPHKFKLPPPPHGATRLALRLGLRQIDGFREAWAQTLTAARAQAPFASVDDLRTRAGLPAAALDHLAAADALGSLNLSRREGLWAAKGLPRDAPAPLFAAAGLDEADGRPPEALPRPHLSQEVVNDYETTRLSLKGHPVGFLRERLRARGAVTAKAYERLPDGRQVTLAGVVLVRQRPGTGNVTFITLEDETGVANVVLWHDLFVKYRPVVMGARLMLVKGRVQQAEGVVHLIGEHLEDISADLATLSQPEAKTSFLIPADTGKNSPDPRERPAAVRHRHPRDVRVLPRSRDFH
ncbi:MAG: error-prone polymerase [Caulobacteraceae bacterium]|nr:error-prone polymerase [Caulobacteraceae bacterium]